VSIPQPPGLGRLESSAKGKRLSHTQTPLKADGSLSLTATRSTVIGPISETMIESGARGVSRIEWATRLVSLFTPILFRTSTRLKPMVTRPSQGRISGPVIGTDAPKTQASYPGAMPPPAVPLREYFPGEVAAGLRQAPMVAMTSVECRTFTILPLPLPNGSRLSCGLRRPQSRPTRSPSSGRRGPTASSAG